MKFALILGAFGGFGWGILLGLTTSAEWPDMVIHASGGALLLAILLRWWRGVWLRAWAEARAENSRAVETTRKAAQLATTART